MTAPTAACPLVILAAGRAKRYGGGLKPLAPIGPSGEAIVDMVASDALVAGFSTIIVVINPDTGHQIREHIDRGWPSTLDVRFCVQLSPRGTVDAVRSAWDELGGASQFGVANADDLYGPAALGILAKHLLGPSDDNALVGFRLDHAVIGNSPVTRGVCTTRSDGRLIQIEERRGVVRRSDGAFGTGDDRSPEVLGPDTLVSMNLWGFSAGMGEQFETAMHEAGEGEVLLPELVGALIAAPERGQCFQVLATQSRCVGVTHPDDLELVQHDVAAQISRDERPAALWSAP